MLRKNKWINKSSGHLLILSIEIKSHDTKSHVNKLMLCVTIKGNQRYIRKSQSTP